MPIFSKRARSQLGHYVDIKARRTNLRNNQPSGYWEWDGHISPGVLLGGRSAHICRDGLFAIKK
eukprot:scaffold6626_cov20-Cyclotella_meneghiniana.AAC.1